MPTTVTVNITGVTPYQVYICDNPITICTWIGQTNTSPYQFNVPSPMDGQSDYTVKVIDDNGCEKTYIVTV